MTRFTTEVNATYEANLSDEMLDKIREVILEAEKKGCDVGFAHIVDTYNDEGIDVAAEKLLSLVISSHLEKHIKEMADLDFGLGEGKFCEVKSFHVDTMLEEFPDEEYHVVNPRMVVLFRAATYEEAEEWMGNQQKTLAVLRVK